jgi:4-amino-4-deoxy-L-arabinose transferase-like glycosyltransferase
MSTSAKARAVPAAGLPRTAARVYALDLAAVLALALVLRLMTYNGLFGSDDGTYLGRAIDVASGTWASANYNGALRYGFNIPAGLFVWLFGPSAFAANLWPLLCSLIEVGTVYAVAASVLDRRAGLFAAVLLATTPLHIAVATRIHADPVVSMFVTLSFALLWFGWLRRDPWLLFASGLAMGGIFWAKELVAVLWLAFVPLLWMFRGRWRDTLPVIGGLLLTLLMHGLLMTWIAGDPLHLVKTVMGQVKTNFIGEMKGEDAAGYYLRYLFVDVRHNGLLAFLTLAALWFVPRALRSRGASSTGLAFVLAWLLSVLLVLSVFPVSLDPLRFVMKQSNYITLFIAPMAVLAGLALASMPRFLAMPLLLLSVLIGVFLGLMQQADYRAFGANSKSLGEWAAAQSQPVVVVGSVNSASLGPLWAWQHVGGRPVVIESFRDLAKPAVQAAVQAAAPGSLYAVLDPQTMQWFAGQRVVKSPLSCWEWQTKLSPANLGLGNAVAGAVAKLAHAGAASGLPKMGSIASAFEALALPKPADLYRVAGADPLCRA